MNCLTRPLVPLLLLASATSFAGTPIEQTRAANPDARIDVTNVKGSVTVSGWDKPEVAISGTLGDGAKGLLVEGDASHLTIKVQAPDKQGWFSWGADTRMGATELDLKVPRAAAMKIEVVSADVTLDGVAGRTLDVASVSGKLRLDSGAKEVGIGSVSGNIELVGSAERARLETVSGDIRTRGLTGQVKFDTVSGDIDADNGAYREVAAGTVSGDISLRGTPAPGARVEVTTMSGDVRLYLPADIAARLRASTFSGRIRSDFGEVKRPEHGPGSSLDASLGNGDGQVRIETFSGDVEIRKP
ncbi:MAG: DUF4097 domain-containing protein [Rhodanobacteraceae bacterium]|jgi:DUF4097 and DUF4098 domain-containing protein YvlB|nr:DUF4097 domain-containing protein [Rhodanobacteraceae bacterium]